MTDSTHYWEAWRVAPNTSTPIPDDKGKPVGDHINLTPQPGISGNVTWSTSARFYEGLSELPGFITENPATHAHSLLSTVDDPRLPNDNATPPADRHYNYSW